MRLAANLAGEKMAQRAKCLETFSIDIIIIDMDAEPILKIGEQAGHGHGVKLGQCAKERSVGIKFRDLGLVQTKNGDQAGAKGPVSAQCRAVLIWPVNWTFHGRGA